MSLGPTVAVPENFQAAGTLTARAVRLFGAADIQFLVFLEPMVIRQRWEGGGRRFSRGSLAFATSRHRVSYQNLNPSTLAVPRHSARLILILDWTLYVAPRLQTFCSCIFPAPPLSMHGPRISINSTTCRHRQLTLLNGHATGCSLLAPPLCAAPSRLGVQEGIKRQGQAGSNTRINIRGRVYSI